MFVVFPAVGVLFEKYVPKKLQTLKGEQASYVVCCFETRVAVFCFQNNSIMTLICQS